MKIIPTIKSYIFKLELSQEEAIQITKELGELKCELDYNKAVPVPVEYRNRLFMVLHDALEDLDLVPKTPNRNKGDKSYPRLEDDEVEVEENLK